MRSSPSPPAWAAAGQASLDRREAAAASLEHRENGAASLGHREAAAASLGHREAGTASLGHKAAGRGIDADKPCLQESMHLRQNKIHVYCSLIGLLLEL